ncbi:hypothetical protein REPUB_Repub19eG0109700 [Reevesia pubescens]
MKMGWSGRFMDFIMLMIMLTATATISAAQSKPSCQSWCGNLSVPYPFGTQNGCFMEPKFFIRCENNTAFLQDSNIDVLHVNILDGQLRIRNWVGFDCYNSSGPSSNFNTWLRSGLYNISNTKNKFTAIGCDTYAFIQDFIGQNYATGCLSLCNEITDVINGSCSDLNNPDLNRKLPMILDWTIGSQTCSEAKMDPENYACKENTFCQEPGFGNGYLCKCSEGFQGNPFQGNPYLSNGCQDINECETLKPCNSTCQNTFGSFNCSCPEGFEGDGLRNGTGCSPKVNHQNKKYPIIQIAIG